MKPVSCQACGHVGTGGARFCASCGTKLDLEEILELGDDSTTPTSQDDDTIVTAWARTLVPVGVAILIGVVGVTIFTSNGADTPAETTHAPTSSPADPSEIDAAVSNEPTSTIVSTDAPSTPVGADEVPARPATVADLPEIDATHLALAVRAEVLFLELGTGTWSRHDAPDFWPTHLPVEPFDRGVLLPRGHDALFIDVDGGTTVIGSAAPTSRLIGAGDLVVLVKDDSGAPLEPVVVTAFTSQGSELWSRDFSPRSSIADGVTSDGRVLVQSGGWVRLVDGFGEQDIGVGLAGGIIDDWVVLYTCETSTECSTELVDAVSGRRVALDLSVIQVNPASKTLFGTSDGRWKTFRVSDGRLDELTAAEFADTRSIWREVRANNGASVRASSEGLLITDGDGHTTLLAAPTSEPCCSEGTQVVFLDLGDR